MNANFNPIGQEEAESISIFNDYVLCRMVQHNSNLILPDNAQVSPADFCITILVVGDGVKNTAIKPGLEIVPRSGATPVFVMDKRFKGKVGVLFREAEIMGAWKPTETLN